MFHSISRARRYTLGTLLCVAAATVTACAHSQQAPPADSASPRDQGDSQGARMRHRSGPRGDRMLEGLNLTKDQRDQINVIRDRYKLQADSMRMGGAAHDSTSRSAFRSLMMQEMHEIRGVLTPDQQKQFDDKMAQMRERRRENGQRGDYDHRGDHNGAPADSTGSPPA
ncbi:MAG TPA: Spy/CpxP family protein refolding chaperone [Gemmatimonadaceae bacterium]